MDQGAGHQAEPPKACRQGGSPAWRAWRRRCAALSRRRWPCAPRHQSLQRENGSSARLSERRGPDGLVAGPTGLATAALQSTLADGARARPAAGLACREGLVVEAPHGAEVAQGGRAVPFLLQGNPREDAGSGREGGSKHGTGLRSTPCKCRCNARPQRPSFCRSVLETHTLTAAADRRSTPMSPSPLPPTPACPPTCAMGPSLRTPCR